MIAEHIEVHLPDNDADRWLFIGTGEEPPHQNTMGYRWRQAHVPHFSEPFYVPHPSACSTRRISAASSSAVSSLILRPRST